MGRRKIIIKQIPDVKLRHITFNKRKNGLFKKAAELSMLCNLNLLLVCEDGLGNLIQYSKNKITDISGFLSQCNYQTIVDLTADDYPDFARINKKKDKDNQESESGMEDDLSPPQEEERNTRTFQQMAAQHREAPKNQHSRNLPGEANHISEDFSSRSQRLKRGLNMVTSVSEQPPSSSLVNESEITAKKNKNKLNLRLKIPKPETANESANQQQQQQVQIPLNHNNDNGIRMPSAANMDSMGMPMRKQNDFPQIRPMDKPLDFTSPPFMPYMDLKSLRGMSNMSNIYEPPMTSPFKFYAQNGRIEPSLNSVFKGMSPFAFNIAGTPLVPKMSYNEAEEKLLDTASAIRYINRAGLASDLAGSSHSNPGHKVFTFQADEQSNQQVQNRNELLMAAAANQRPIPNQLQNQIQNQIQMQTQMQEYVNLPSVPKSEPETDMNIPLDTFSARRFNFDGYFKDFDESAYADPRKKYKMG